MLLNSFQTHLGTQMGVCKWEDKITFAVSGLLDSNPMFHLSETCSSYPTTQFSLTWEEVRKLSSMNVCTIPTCRPTTLAFPGATVNADDDIWVAIGLLANLPGYGHKLRGYSYGSSDSEGTDQARVWKSAEQVFYHGALDLLRNKKKKFFATPGASYVVRLQADDHISLSATHYLLAHNEPDTLQVVSITNSSVWVAVTAAALPSLSLYNTDPVQASKRRIPHAWLNDRELCRQTFTLPDLDVTNLLTYMTAMRHI